jgi:hypothetical protein
MLAELQQGPTRAEWRDRAPAAAAKADDRQLVIEDSRHEAVEEMYFWPAVRGHLANGGTLADEATGQEQEAKEVLSKLDKLDADNREFEKLLSTFTASGLGAPGKYMSRAVGGRPRGAAWPHIYHTGLCVGNE